MRVVHFDGEAITHECPKSDIGIATSEECQACPSFGGFSGFDADCKYDVPEIEDESLISLAWLSLFARNYEKRNPRLGKIGKISA